jgi:RecT family protein
MPTKTDAPPAEPKTGLDVVKSEAAGAVITASGFTPGQVEVVRNLFAKGATDDELAVFLRLAAKYDLDPMAREVWCICELDDKGERKTDRTGQPRPPMIQASRAGWRKIAQREPSCTGIESGAVYSKDSFRRLPEGGVDHQISLDVDNSNNQDRGKIVGAYALVWRSDWTRPAFAWASWQDYGATQVKDANGKWRTYSPWYKYPSAMIEKQAESMALRQAFPIGALAAGDDLPVEASEGERLDGDAIEVPTETPRSASSNAHEGAAHTSDDEPLGTSPEAPGGELFPPSQDELDALAEDEARHRDPTSDDPS